MVTSPDANPLARYWAKRDFAITSEPRGAVAPLGATLAFVIQKHSATRLHYDLRLELDGVMLSWAVPKGPSYDPTEKRLAVHVEDHPLSYNAFEGAIPAKQYGAGNVIVWDNGTWEPLNDPHEGLRTGKLVFNLRGHKLTGMWELVKIAKPGEAQEPWLLFKKRDRHARPKADYDVVTALPDSVLGRPEPTAARDMAEAKPPTPSARRRTTPGKTRPERARPEQARPEKTSPETDPNAAPHDPGAVEYEPQADAHPHIRGALRAALPARLAPQLATAATVAPAGGDWRYEIKFDGYRLMTRIDAGQPLLFTRGGHDWSSKMPVLVGELARLGLDSAWLDGEIVVLNEAGLPDFNGLQNALDHRASSAEIVYFLFDVPFLEGYDLRAVALHERRQLLQALLEQHTSDHLRFSAGFDTDAAAILASARRMNLEGVIAKRADAPYVSRRSDTWLKLKCKHRQEFVVGGFTARGDSVDDVGSLLLGVYDPGGELVSAGSVGTGWSAAEAVKLMTQLARREMSDSPFATPPVKPGRWSKRAAGSERWVKPQLVVEVEFTDWTPEGRVRHGVYLGMRTDKPAARVVREAQLTAAPDYALPGAIKVTHGERVIDPASGLTKLDLVRYYAAVADWMLPHLQGRPCSLVRGPAGVTGQLFFQKHGEQSGIPGIRELDPEVSPGHAALLEVATAQALVGAAQLNVIEFHTSNAPAKHSDRPDRMIFDLDPGKGTPWQHVQEAALLVRGLLAELGLECWLKTSGGKGLHVVVPLTPKLSCDAVKDFSRAVVLHLAGAVPSRFVAKSGPANRVGKLFVDYLRNGRGATTVAAFSARARPGLGVSMPVSWDDLGKLKGGAHWTVATARDYLSFQAVDPWAFYWRKRQTLTQAMQRLGFDPDQADG